MVSPEGTQDGNRMPTKSPVTAATTSPATERPEETQDEVHIKGMISGSTDSGIFPYIEN